MDENRKKEELEEKIGYWFQDKAILDLALTHSSYSNEKKTKTIDMDCNERLEFLGDSILSLLVSEYLFFKFPKLPEGELTRMRASAVCEKTLSKLANIIELGQFLYLGHGEEVTNGRERKSILADAFEALLAAIFIDGGKEKVQKFLLPLVEPEISQFVQNGSYQDYKTLLQQIIQQEHGELLEYVLVKESGPDHAKLFEIEARLNSNIIGHGSGKSKREAEQNAAKEALVLFGEDQS